MEPFLTKKPFSSLLKAKDYSLRARELLKKKQYRPAQVLLQKGLTEVGKTAEAHHLLGIALFLQGFFKESLKQFQKAVEREARAEYFLNLSIALNELGQYERASKVYEKALRLKSQAQEESWKEELMEKHSQTAQVYLRKDKLKPALTEYIKADKSFSTPFVKIEIAKLLWKLNQKTLAEKYLKSFIQLYPKNIPARLLKAKWHFANKDLPLSINEWENVLKLEPNNQTAMNALLKAQNIYTL